MALLLGLAAVAAAQQPSDPAAAQATSEPEVVPVGQVGARSTALRERLVEIQAGRPTQALAEIEARLRELEASAAKAAERVDAMLARRRGPGEVEAQAASLRRLDRSFDSLEARIDAMAQALARTASEIEEETGLWERTLRRSRESEAPEVVQVEARRVLQDLARGGEGVAADLESALEFRQALGEVEVPLRTAIARTEAVKRELASGLFVRQDEPVWRWRPAAGAVDSLPGAVRDQFAAVLGELGPYAREHPRAIVLHGLALLLMVWLLPRIRSQRDPSDQDGSAFDALRHPWAAALLMTCLLTPFLQPERVRAVQLLLIPVGLGAWFRVFAGAVAADLRGPLGGVAAVALLEVLRSTLAGLGLPAVGRTLLVVELGAALAGILWLRRPKRLAHVPWRGTPSPWLRLLDGWMRLLPPALGVGLVGALLGYTDLAERVALVSIWGTVSGAAWVLVVRILETLARSLIDWRGSTGLRMVATSRAAILRGVPRGVRALALLTWLYLTLNLAGLWSPARLALGAVLSASIGFGPVSISLGGVGAFVLTLWVSWLTARFTAFVLEQEVFSRLRMSPGVPFAIATFTRYAILVLGFVVAMGALGFSLDRVTLLLSALGVGIGFGLQNVVSNFVSGAILLFERPIRVGDWVQLDELFGVVSTIGIRASNVRTFDGSEVIVPNGDLVSARVVNWTLSDRKRRIILPVGVAYGTKPRQVIEILEQVARAQPKVLEDPAPTVLFRGFGDSSLNFEIRAWTEGDWFAVMSDLAVATSEALDEADIRIPFPQRDLHLRNPDALRDALKEALRESRTRLPDDAPS